MKIKNKLNLIVDILIVTLFLFNSCEKERIKHNSFKEISLLKTQISRISLSHDDYDEIKLSKNSHIFSDFISFKQVKVYKKKKADNKYTFIWIIDPIHTDFEELNKWKIGMIIKPKFYSDFKDETLQRKGIKTQGVLTKPRLLNNQVCIVLKEFSLIPKQLGYVKFYLYNYSGKVNLKYWLIKDVIL